MAAQASFIAVDSLAANHTFTRVNIDGSSVRYQERAGVSSLSWKNFNTNLRPPAPGNGAKVYKADVKYTMPIVVEEVINGVTVPKKVREFSAELKILVPSEASEAEAELFMSSFTSALSTATLKDLTVKLLPLNGP